MTRYTNLHRFAVFTACCTFLLLIAGGLVTSTDSGLSVPDWPNTYGHFMFAYPLDQMVGGIFYEHSHRMIASFVGFLTVLLAIWLWKREDRVWLRNLGFIALAAVIVQGILGGLTVLFFLPTAISVSHATLAQTFFAVVASIALFTSSWWRSARPSDANSAAARRLLRVGMIATGAIYVQLILGAVMRHMDAGLAVPDLPLAYGQLFPSLSPGALEGYNHQLIQSNIRIWADGAVTGSQILVHMMHRFWAIVVSVLVTWLAIRLVRSSALDVRLSRLGVTLLALLGLQITLGVLTVLSVKAIDITTAHVANGALLLVTSVLTTLHAARISGAGFRTSSNAISTREVTA